MEEHRDLSSSTPRHSAEHLLATAQNYQTPPSHLAGRGIGRLAA
jgi:hypothetical protein